MAITGTPAAIASSSELDKPSLSDGSTEISISGSISRDVVAKSSEDDAFLQPPARRIAFQLALVAAVRPMTVAADDQESNVGPERCENGGGIDEVFYALHTIQTRANRDQPRVRGNPKFLTEPAAARAGHRRRSNDTVANHLDFPRRISLADEPAAHAFRVGQDAIGHATEHFLGALL